MADATKGNVTPWPADQSYVKWWRTVQSWSMATPLAPEKWAPRVLLRGVKPKHEEIFDAACNQGARIWSMLKGGLWTGTPRNPVVEHLVNNYEPLERLREVPDAAVYQLGGARGRARGKVVPLDHGHF